MNIQQVKKESKKPISIKNKNENDGKETKRSITTETKKAKFINSPDLDADATIQDIAVKQTTKDTAADFCVSTVIKKFEIAMNKKIKNKEEEAELKPDKDDMESALLIPKFQRPYRWKPRYQIKLIESIFCGRKIPLIYVAKDSTKNYDYIIDGRQRIQTLWRFRYDKFPVLYKKKYCYYSELPRESQTTFLKGVIHFNLCENYTNQQIKDLFNCLNNTQTLTMREKMRAINPEIFDYMKANDSYQELQEICKTGSNREKGYLEVSIVYIALLATKREKLDGCKNGVDVAERLPRPFPKKKLETVLPNIFACLVVIVKHLQLNEFRMTKIHLITLADFLLHHSQGTGTLSVSYLKLLGAMYNYLLVGLKYPDNIMKEFIDRSVLKKYQLSTRKGTTLLLTQMNTRRRQLIEIWDAVRKSMNDTLNLHKEPQIKKRKAPDMIQTRQNKFIRTTS